MQLRAALHHSCKRDKLKRRGLKDPLQKASKKANEQSARGTSAITKLGGPPVPNPDSEAEDSGGEKKERHDVGWQVEHLIHLIDSDGE